MASSIVQDTNTTVRGLGGKKIRIPYYLQFISGHVLDVVHSNRSLRYKGENSLNSIIAAPHYLGKKVFEKGTVLGDKYRYFPLLRGITDVPSKGDPVLLCTIGQINYYLGPINTITNNPTWNDDHLYTSDVYNVDGIDSTLITSPKGLKGESLNFNKQRIYSRMTKLNKFDLDYGTTQRETTGDTMLEGRHGNSIRIGSRSNNPYVFISNQRAADNPSETLGDGSLISITAQGTLRQHFDSFAVNTTEDFEIIDGFTLASDLISTLNDTIPNRFMRDLVYNVNGNVGKENPITGTEMDRIYDYTNNQMLLHSDRITLNSKLDDIYLSSNKDIHIGTRRHLTISTSEDLIISSQRTFLGNPLPTTKDGEEREMESMVLGTTLLELLNETLDVIKNSQGICQGAPIALADETGTVGGVNQKITDIQNKINTILSTKHFIEPNA